MYKDLKEYIIRLFNPNSTMQLRQLFFDIIGLKSKKKTATGALSVDKEVLQTLDHPLAQAVSRS